VLILICPRRRLRVLLAALLTLVSMSSPGRAADAECRPASGISSCIDATSIWLPTGRPQFVVIAPAEPIPLEVFAFGAALAYANRPIVLVAASPDPEGREIRVVDHRVDLSLLWAYAPRERLELTFATPMVLYQTGAGAEGITSQRAPPLTSSAARDPRLGAGYSFVVPEPIRRTTELAVKARTELLLPLGDKHLYAAESGFVLAPAIAASIHPGIFFAGAELGVRLRETTHLATTSLGSQLVSSLGLGIDILGRDQLSFGAEATLMPTLVAQNRARDDAVLVPAEWLASLRSAPFSDRALLLQLGGGTGLPLSSRADESGTEHHLGVTTPRLRLVLAVRYAPTEPVKTPARARRSDRRPEAEYPASDPR
jgi:hypothetical protein